MNTEFMRRRMIVANWKMNLLLEEAEALFSQLSKQITHGITQVVVCPPFPYLYPLWTRLEKDSPITLGAQNCHQQSFGAYTGEVSAPMLKALHAKYVILGHSERREYYKETGEELYAKINSALQHDVIPIYCCGEPLAIRNAEAHQDFVKGQIEESLFHLQDSVIKKVIIAYEPVWAIGSNNTATPHQIQDMHTMIRNYIASKYTQDIAEAMTIIYGGSVKADNARAIFDCLDVDGALVGGASLQEKEFLKIVQLASPTNLCD